MSHFLVTALIPKDTENVEDVVGNMLAPFQENNMGDCPERFLEFNDMEDEYRKEYDNKKDRHGVAMNVKYKTFDEFCAQWHGSKRDPKRNRYGYWENPKAKWDWWVIGGRWNGHMLSKDPAENKDNYNVCAYCNGTGSRTDFSYEGPGGDWARAGNKAFPCKGTGCNACYGSGMQLKSRQNDCGNVCPVANLPEGFTSFAFLTPEGEWIERGQMGFAVVANEQDEGAWKNACAKILERYRDCHAVAVDCHI